MIKMIYLLLLSLGFALSVSAVAAPMRYGAPGHENHNTYTFTASNDGDIIAYWADINTARYLNTLSLLVNGIDRGISGLNNHDSAIGDSINFGHVNAGDSLIFRLNVLTKGYQWFSDPSMNADGLNHIYSDYYAGDALLPEGTYVSFEDLYRGGDLNYHDENFVFTNIHQQVSQVPVPAAIWLFSPCILGLLRLGKVKKS